MIKILLMLMRIEKKLDELLKILATDKVNPVYLQPMDFDRQVCPLCKKPINYGLDDINEPTRECGCNPPIKEK
jgi:hypothetical protein